ncbi:MAG: hypothetical protein ACLQU4_21320 [Limisphaerales bacterium]
MIRPFKSQWLILAAFVSLCGVAAVSPAIAASYSYDSLNRLTNVDYGSGSVIRYTYDAAGNRLTYSGAVGNDTIAPVIAISSPTTGSDYTNNSATINLRGTSSDNVGVTLVTWANYSDDTLGSAAGTTSWSIAGIPLQTGDNYIFVTAYDAAGNSTDAAITVTSLTGNGGSLEVTISPPAAVAAGAKWQVDGGTFQYSGATVSNLSVGNHTVSFNTVSGWITPSNQSVSVTANSTAMTTGTYQQTGSLKVTITPAAAVTVGAKWQVDGGQVQSSGATVSGLSVGTNNHTVTFVTISGWTTPPSKTVSVQANSTVTASGVYVVVPPPGSLEVTIAPTTAVAAGALWQVDGGAFEGSGATVPGLSVGHHTINFNSVGGWTTPASQTVSVRSKQTTKAKGTYAFSAKGMYNGLFSVSTGVTEETAGMLNGLTIGSLGSYSGRLLTDGRAYSFTGGFNAASQASNHISRAANLGGPLTMEMTLNWNDAPPNITGTVSGTNGGPWVANLDAELAVKGSGSAAYTVLVPPPTNENEGFPPGFGYILMTNHTGTFILSVTLADGTSFSQAVPVSGMGDLPVYGNLYSSTGLLLGWIGLESGSPTGNLTWIKKASRSTALYTNGLTNLTVVQGSSWTNPSPHTAAINLPLGQLDISGGNLLAPLSFDVALSNNNALVRLPGSPTNSLTGSINAKTGLLTVTFGEGIGKATVVGHGAVLQNTNVAAGFFLGKTNAGSILLQPKN